MLVITSACIYQNTSSDAVSSVSSGVRCLCVVNQEAAQIGGPTSPYQAKSGRYIRPTAPFSASPSPHSLPHIPDTLYTALNRIRVILYLLTEEFLNQSNTGF